MFWLAMTGWLVVSEVMPGVLTRASISYRSMLSEGLLIADNWMRITLRGEPIGYSHTKIEADEENPIARYQVYNHTVLNVTVMGEQQDVRVTARASLDALYHLQNFVFAMSSREYTLTVSGRRVTGETFAVTMRSGGNTDRARIEIPDDAIVYSPMLELALRQLKPGQETRVRIFNPVSMATGTMTVEALRRETIEVRGEEVETTVVAGEYQGMEILSWIDPDGRAVRQETAFGWRLEACDPEDALAAGSGGQNAEDILLALAVPASRPIADPRSVARLTLRLHGPALSAAALESHRQRIVEEVDGGIELVVSRESLPDSGLPLGAAPPEMQPFLEGSSFIQVSHPRIARRARAIVEGETDSLRAALAIYRWVFENVRKTPTVSVPSAADVLDIMSGDCNEHTYLFTALARAAGIPARITVGLTYNEGAFYYHAWPSVYVGRWVEMDPTLGQPAVDATHIRLLQGELQDQMKLMGMIGQLRVEVLETP